jgi:MATE family multidrug resistance protein
VALKVPLNTLFMYGAEPLGVPAMGGAGCGVASAVVAWVSGAIAMLWLALDRSYARYALLGWSPPDRARLRELLLLGVPIGAAYVVEITSFTFMALFVARFGAIPSASHQVAANLVGVAYMAALGIASATSTLVAQSIGGGDPLRARRYGLAGLRMALVIALAAAAALWLAREPIARGYSADPEVVRASLALVGLAALFHVFDSLQTQLGFILRAYKIATLPMVVYVASMWGIGLGGGYWLTVAGGAAGVLHGGSTGATGFWVAGVASLVVASAGLAALLARTWRQVARAAPG